MNPPLAYRRAAAVLLVMGALGALGAGCGLDSLSEVNAPEIRTLFPERTFTQGDLEITEQVSVTSLSVGTLYQLRATVLNLGPDLADARFEMVLQDEIVEGNGRHPPTIRLGEEEVADSTELGTLFSSQTQSVSLEAQVLGGQRVRVSGRVVTSSAP